MANLKVGDIGAWLARHKFWTAFVLVIIFGYAIGKDAAVRDNARDAAQQRLSLSS